MTIVSEHAPMRRRQNSVWHAAFWATAQMANIKWSMETAHLPRPGRRAKSNNKNSRWMWGREVQTIRYSPSRTVRSAAAAASPGAGWAAGSRWRGGSACRRDCTVPSGGRRARATTAGSASDCGRHLAAATEHLHFVISSGQADDRNRSFLRSCNVLSTYPDALRSLHPQNMRKHLHATILV